MSHNKICILDYGSGNVRSVFNILIALGVSPVVSNKTEDIKDSSHIILPGVGAFGASMEKIKKAIPLNALENEVLKNQKPFLGICVGMQVLADRGFEFGEHTGLGWISGTVEKLDAGAYPLPHIGWNGINIINDTPLLKGFNSNQDFYFVHSYVFKEKNHANVIAKTEYGENFNSVISKDNIFGVQFHPEKSQKAGKILLQNFIDL
ncbi:MAG: imidazole glycerol phosphate synthase subunit HisH [bacterium]|nr:imidazole glycerol phosphate synthase subunit HisH [bacterium]